MFRNWIRFNLVGVIGFVVQLLALAGLVYLGVHYLVATAIAVEAALFHNFAWHERWTWGRRGSDFRGRAGRLWQFHLVNGVVSIAGNLGMMRLLVGGAGMAALRANLIAVVVCSTINFIVGHSLIWVRSESKDQRYEPA